ncbi:leucine-rich repeat domain-containing protein [Subtercola boreus]|uniref:Ig-like domain-containing protein n=1 Tax=Subtercola boreus TaxID=120213 RepID=A0A3E0W654_9MICO|nr:leucine-rich repeat domain-containing protein [Subtercola boreus]RFA18003.1 hypothetical protein B7R24_15210 [Subtercola boreus]RFA18385.1 hypothetical protein B7R23_15245 [Subtercola boreus]RFA24914.1 hypothetical protein B7R25_15240 [Subtercola boreus]
MSPRVTLSRRRRLAAAATSLVLAGIAVFGAVTPAVAASPVVPFADAKLKACVLATLGLPGPDVTLADLQGIVGLDCSGAGITDVTPLAQATALTSLDLSSNSIAVLPSLSKLKALVELDLSQNELADLGSLAGLSALENLDAGYNRIQGISVLRSLFSLQTLRVPYNSIGSVGDLSTLNDLDFLDLSHNSIASAPSFTPGAVLRELNLSFNLLSDIQFTSRLSTVTLLNLSYNRVTGAVPLGSSAATVNLENQSVQLSPIAVDVPQALPVVRNARLDPVAVQLSALSQANGRADAGGFTWRSDGVGQLIWADTDTRPGGNVISFSGHFTQTVTRGGLTAPTPTVSGTPRLGETLTASAGAWGPAPVALAYQWRSNGFDIGGATASSYVIAPGDLGKTMSVAVTGSKASYAVTMVSAATAAVTARALTATPVPTIAGTAKVGSTLNALTGTWSPAPVALTYQWMRGRAPIAGATNKTYAVTNADAEQVLTVSVTGAKSGYTSVTKTSAPTATVTGGTISPVVPKIGGALAPGKTLTAVTGDWTPAPITYHYQWKRNGVEITGASQATYLVTSADLGTKVTVTVEGSRSGYATVVRTSAPALSPK